MEIGVIILAAGGSHRLGEPKQLLRFHGSTLLRRAVEAARDSHADHCMVVLGHEAEACAGEIANLPMHIEVNDGWRDGLASSIRAGLAAVQRRHPAVDAVILAACDQPFLTADVLNTLMDTHLATSCGIVASAYAGTRGIPALFCAAWFPKLASLEGDRGAKALFDAADRDLTLVPFPQGTLDVDTAGDYANALEALK